MTPAAAGFDGPAERPGGAGPLVSPGQLAALLQSPSAARVRVLDVRWRLGGPPGREDYRAGHVPGAVYVDLDTELSGPVGEGTGRHPLPDVDDLQAAARSWGVHRGDAVVAYDAAGGMAAARAWWLLRWAGLDDVRVLDGGLAAWQAAGYPVVADGDGTAAGDARTGDVTLSPGHLAVLDPDGVERLLADGGLVLDARPADRYAGTVNPYDPVPGHVPGAVSAPAVDNLGSDGRFRPPADLAERFARLGAVPGRAVGVYCGSGVTAAHDMLALELAGVTGVALYPGSWSQWATLPGRRVATGSEPGSPPDAPAPRVWERRGQRPD